MFAFSILFKLLTWYLALKVGDTGRPSRPWILGALIACVFALFDCFSVHHDLNSNLTIVGAYLFAGLAIMHSYYRTQGVVLSLLVIAVGTAVLFLGIPYFTAMVSES